MIARHSLVIEDEAGAFDFIDPLDIVSIRASGTRKARKRQR